MSPPPLGLIGLFIGAPLTLITIWLFYMVHIYTEKAEALMPNSRFVEANIGVFSQAGLMGKAMRNGFLTVVLLTPTLTVKRGFVSVANVRKLPKGLRQKLVVTWGSSTFFFFALIALNMYRRYIE